jgi:phage tail sheath protein FI
MAQNIPFGSGAAGVQWSETNNSFYTLPTNTQINGAIFIVAPFGPVNTPTYITSVQQLVQTFGTYSQGVGDGNLT